MGEYSKDRKYFLKLPKEFFNSYWVKILEGMPNGQAYLLMYMKLMCESISHGGYLRFSKDVPYTAEMIASATNTNVDTARSGLQALRSLGLVEETEDATLLLPKVEEMTESTTRGAERMAEYRQKKEKHGQLDAKNNEKVTNVTQMSEICSTDIRSKKLELEVRGKKQESELEDRNKKLEERVTSYGKEKKNDIEKELKTEKDGFGIYIRSRIIDAEDPQDIADDLNRSGKGLWAVRDGKVVSAEEAIR